jgi:hypothetical protein
VPKESFANEQRVALSPAGVATLIKAGFKGVVVESGAGALANFPVSLLAGTAIYLLFFACGTHTAPPPPARPPARRAPVAPPSRIAHLPPPPTPTPPTHTPTHTHTHHHPRQDSEYIAAGATIGSTSEAFGADLVLKVRPPDAATEAPLLRDGGRLVSMVYPAQNKALVDALAAKKMTVIGEQWEGRAGVERRACATGRKVDCRNTESWWMR